MQYDRDNDRKALAPLVEIIELLFHCLSVNNASKLVKA